MIALLPTICLFACVMHLSFDAKNMQKLALKTKFLASLAFVGFAWDLDAWDMVYGQWLFFGLLSSMIGDVLLSLKKHKHTFVIGITAFLLAHFFYAVAFYQLGFNTAKLPLIMPFVLISLIITILWLRVYLQGIYRIVVPVYLLGIGTMLVFAWCNQAPGAFWWIVSGATLFAISDLFVARHRFIKEESINKIAGLPLYYVAQLILAYTVTLVYFN